MSNTGSLTVLDAHPDGIIYRELVPEYVDVVRTIYEGTIHANTRIFLFGIYLWFYFHSKL